VIESDRTGVRAAVLDDFGGEGRVLRVESGGFAVQMHGFGVEPSQFVIQTVHSSGLLNHFDAHRMLADAASSD
jgi:hypothetical protein